MTWQWQKVGIKYVPDAGGEHLYDVFCQCAVDHVIHVFAFVPFVVWAFQDFFMGGISLPHNQTIFTEHMINNEDFVQLLKSQKFHPAAILIFPLGKF